MSTSTGSGATRSIAAISSGVTTGITSLSDDERDGDDVGVAQRQRPRADAPLAGERGGLARDRQRRFARVFVAFDVDVVEAVGAEAARQRLHDRFLRREARRVALAPDRVGLRSVAVLPLGGREDPIEE